MKLSSVIQEDYIYTGGKAKSLNEGFAQMAAFFADAVQKPVDTIRNALADRERFEVENGGALHPSRRTAAIIISREKISPFVVAPGIAFPHIREKFLDDFFIFIGLYPEGINLEGMDPIKIIVMFGVPEGKSNLYLRSMAAMARLLSRPGVLDEIVRQPSPEAVSGYILAHDEYINEVVTARDMMETSFPFLTADASLAEAIKLMVSQETCDLPVVENKENMKYLGLVTTGRLLKVGVPDYLMMMDNLNFLKSFEPFQDLLRKAQSTKVGAVIRHDAPYFDGETPMFQVAIKLIESHTEFGVVLEKGRLAGTITRFDFLHKVVEV